LGSAYALAGQLSAAPALLEQAVQEAGSPIRWDHSLDLVRLGEGYLLAGRGDATDVARRALDRARSHGERGPEGWALRLLGELATGADPSQIEQAEDYYRQALVRADELGMRPLAAHCHLGLGSLYQRVGYHAQGEAELATAAEMYRAMAMTFWLEKVEAALAQFAG